MVEKRHIVKCVETGSIAEELGISSGDILISINNTRPKDIFDYQFLMNDSEITVIIRKPNGEEWELEIEKDFNEDLGIEFEEGLMDCYSSCRNKCMFCFIDQMPKGMRETLYFKDDDARLSYLQGNYITLTNLKDEDIDRIILYKLAPINISVHTTNKELRAKMLSNRFAGDALVKMQKLFENGIEMNSQVVCCKGYNDGAELEKTIQDLASYMPYMLSLSIVPVGLTKFRDGLAPLEKFLKEDARAVLDIIHKYQAIYLEKFGTRFVHASDEWYLTAELPIPKADAYEEYGQIENGVGMLRSFIDEFEEYYNTLEGDDRSGIVSIATGKLAAKIMKDLTMRLIVKYPNIKVEVFEITNEFFGPDITVAGLLTGQDIMNQLNGKELGDYLILPSVLLRNGEEVLLDDYTLTDLEKTLQTKIRIVQSDGKSLIDTIINK